MKRTVTYLQLREMHAAVQELSTRRLETRASVKKVVRLLREFLDKPMEAYKDLRNQIIEDYPAPEGWESESLPIGVLEKRQHELNRLDKDTIELPDVPKELRIRDADLPKLIKGELGDQNQVAVGDIIHKLHWLYAEWAETEKEEPVADGEDGETPTES